MKKNIIAIAAFTLILTGCTTMDKNVAVVQLQKATASMMGLASSDELTVSKVSFNEPDAFGGQKISYRAKTQRGRTLDCTANMQPGLLSTPPSVTNPVCVPLSVHK